MTDQRIDIVYLGSADDPADPSNAGLMFQRFNTGNTFIPPGKAKTVKNRDVDDTAVLDERDEEETHSLEKRIPDEVGKVFHPTILGHELVAAHSMMAILNARKKNFKAQPPACALQPPKTDNRTPKCDITLVSGLPANVFNPNTYIQFCEAVEKDPKTQLWWMMDDMGHQLPWKKDKFKRTPPPNPDLYNDFKIGL